MDRDENAAKNILAAALASLLAVPWGTRKQAHQGVCEKLLDRRPLPPHSNERAASPLDERGTPAHFCRGVSDPVAAIERLGIKGVRDECSCCRGIQYLKNT